MNNTSKGKDIFVFIVVLLIGLSLFILPFLLEETKQPVILHETNEPTCLEIGVDYYEPLHLICQRQYKKPFTGTNIWCQNDFEYVTHFKCIKYESNRNE